MHFAIIIYCSELYRCNEKHEHSKQLVNKSCHPLLKTEDNKWGKKNHSAYLCCKWYGYDQHRKAQYPNCIHFCACVVFFQRSLLLDQGSVLSEGAGQKLLFSK